MSGTTNRTSALLAVVACTLVVCSGLAVVPGGAEAQQDLTVEITFNESDGELRVVVQNETTGNFSGGNESVTIDIGGTEVEKGPNPPEGEEYTYVVGQDRLANIFGGQSGSDTSVSVSYRGTEIRSDEVSIRRVTLGSSDGFTEDGGLRFSVESGTTFGLEDGTDVPIRVEGQDKTATYTNTPSPSLVVSRSTLGDLGVLRDPGQIAISGGEAYVQGRIEFNTETAAAPVTATRESSSVQFESALFENGETYVVNVTSSEGQYVRTINAGEQEISVGSAALAAEETLTLTIEHDSGTTVVSGETVGFTTESVTGSVTDSNVTFDSTLDVEGKNATVWVRHNGTIDRSEATLNTSTQNLTLKSPAVLPAENGTVGLLIQFDEEPSPLYATVALQGGTGGAGGGGQEGSGLPIALILIGGGSVLAVVLVAGGVYAGLSIFGSGGGGLNPFGGSSKSNSSNKSPPAETATVSFEVVDELAGRTYREADRVIARQQGGGQTGIGSGSAVGSRNAGRSTGRNTRNAGGGRGGVNTGTSESIDLSAGKGSAELNYGNWAFEVVEKSRTVGQREHTLEYGFDSDHIGLSVTPYTVNVQVTEGPERTPAKRAEVTVTADVERWQSRKRTDPDGRVQFEIPRSASRVTFTAKAGTSQPVEADYRIDQAVQDGVGLAVGAETGKMAIETRVGERAWPGVDVQITPVSEDARAYTDEGTVSTDADGRRKVQNLPTGEYEVSAQPQLDGVETTAAVERMTARNDATTDVTLSIGVSYSMPETYRNRLGDLRERIEELTSATNRDVAIPRYYGTVLTSVLDLAEAVESSPERAVEAGISPDATVEALLDATDAGITAVGGAMSERRNVKLFGAAESMPPAEVDWSGEATLDAFLNQVTEGSKRDRRELRNRLEETDDVLDQKWGEVNEIAPARKLHDRMKELAQETGGIDDELTVVARAYVGICLLDAIEGLFEHDALAERLNSGSY